MIDKELSYILLFSGTDKISSHPWIGNGDVVCELSGKFF